MPWPSPLSRPVNLGQSGHPGIHTDERDAVNDIIGEGPFSPLGHSHGSGGGEGGWPRVFVIEGTHSSGGAPSSSVMSSNADAIDAAQNAAIAAGGGIVLHPGGRFFINRTIERKEGNRWIGNMGSSSPRRYPAFIWGGGTTTDPMFRMVKDGAAGNYEFSDTWYLAFLGARGPRYLIEFPQQDGNSMRPDMSGFYFCQFNGNNGLDSQGAGFYIAAVTNLYMHWCRFDAMSPYTFHFRNIFGQVYLTNNQWDQGLTTHSGGTWSNTAGTPTWRGHVKIDLVGDHGPMLVIGDGVMENNAQPVAGAGHIIELFDSDPGTNQHRFNGSLFNIKAPIGAGVSYPSTAAWLRLNHNRTTWVNQFAFQNIARGPSNILSGAEIAPSTNRKNLFTGASISQGGSPNFLLAASSSNLGTAESLSVLRQGVFARML